MPTTGQFSSYTFGSGNPAILDKMKDVAYDPEAAPLDQSLRLLETTAVLARKTGTKGPARPSV